MSGLMFLYFLGVFVGTIGQAADGGSGNYLLVVFLLVLIGTFIRYQIFNPLMSRW